MSLVVYAVAFSLIILSGSSFAEGMKQGKGASVIHVTGKGVAKAQANQAQFNLVMADTQLSLDEAREVVDRDVESLLDAVSRFDIDQASIDSSKVQIHPQHDYNNRTNERTFVGYRVERQVSFKLNDLTELDKLVKKISKENINRLDQIALVHSQPESIKQAAMLNAIENSKQTAHLIAQAYDIELGKVHRVSYSELSAPRPMHRAAMMEVTSADASSTYQAKDLEFKAHVEVEFKIK